MLRTTATVAAMAALVPCSPAQEDPWEPHRELSVLYAGYAGGSREAAFEAFLRQWFDEVETIPLGDLSMESAADHDVVIADWMSQYGNDGYPKPDGGLHGVPVSLGPDFTKPVISMTYVASGLRRDYKLDWL